MAHYLLCNGSGTNARIQVDTCRNAHVFEHVDQFLRRDVATGTGSERTTAETSGGRVEVSNTVLHSRKRASKTSATRVVEVRTQAEVTYSFAHSSINRPTRPGVAVPMVSAIEN